MAEISTYAGALSTGGQSPRIWGSCPQVQLWADPGRGFIHTEQFKSVPVTTTTETTAALTGFLDRMKYVIAVSGASTGGTVSAPIGNHGKLALITGADDTAAVSIGFTNGVHGCVELAANRRCWFEARIAVDNTTDIMAFIGLASPGTLVAGGMLDSAVSALLTTGYHVGFHIRETTAIALVHRSSTAGTDIVVSTAAGTISSATIESETLFKNLGLYFDGTTLHYYIDNVLVGTVARTATNFPAATVELAPFIGILPSADAAKTLWVDWFKIAVEYA